jgi:hypothetical protein
MILHRNGGASDHWKAGVFLAVSQEKVASLTSLDVFVAHEATLVFGLLESIKGYIGYNLETLHRDLKTAM